MAEPVREQITQFAKDERGVSKVAIGLGVAALAATGIGVGAAISNRGHEQTQVPATPTPSEATATPRPTNEIKTPAGTFKIDVSPSPEVFRIPDVINKDTVKFIVLSPAEVQKMIDDAKLKGEDKIALPDMLNNDGISLIVVHDKQSKTLLAIKGDKEGDYTLPALNTGKVLETAINNASTFSEIATISPDNKVSFYIIPNPSSSSLVRNADVTLSQQIVTFKYDPKGNGGQSFIRFLHIGYSDAPDNTMALIGGGTNNGPTSIDMKNILTTQKGEVVLLSAQK